MNPINRITSVLLASLLLISCGSRDTGEQATQKKSESELFMQKLSQFCGEKITGKAEVLNEDLTMQEKEVVFYFSKCTDNEIRMTIETTEPEKTTIILTMVEKELLLKHDVKTHDMIPAEFTMYGGFADHSGDENRQFFPVHNFGGTMWPGFENYSWEMGFLEEENRFYYKERNDDLVTRQFTLTLPAL